MIFKSNAVRSFRKYVMTLVRCGLATLRVIGDSKSGFRLAAVLGNKKTPKVVPLYQERTFDRQSEAVTFGRIKFGQKATKLLLNFKHAFWLRLMRKRSKTESIRSRQLVRRAKR